MTTSHQLAAELLKGPDLPVTASIDISTSDEDGGRRLYTHDNGCMGVNNTEGDAGLITILFSAEPFDNDNKRI